MLKNPGPSWLWISLMIAIYEFVEKIRKPLKIFSLALAICAASYILVEFIVWNWTLDLITEKITVWFMVIFLLYLTLNYKLQKTKKIIFPIILWPINIITGLCLFMLSAMNYLGLFEPAYKIVLSWPAIVVGINMLSLAIGHYSRSSYLHTVKIISNKKNDTYGWSLGIAAAIALLIFCAQIPLLIHALMRPEYKFEALQYLSYALDFLGFISLLTLILILIITSLFEEASMTVKKPGTQGEFNYYDDWQQPNTLI